MRRFRPRLTYANVMSTVAVFVALGGGAYAAVSSIPGPDGVIHGCYAKRGGNLRLIAAGRRCSKRETAIAFNQQGQRGRPGGRGATGSRGFNGAQGGAGARGEQGPPGSGASTFATALARGAGPATLATLSNGIQVTGTCGVIDVSINVGTADGSKSFQGSGIVISAGKLTSVTVNVDSAGLGSSSEKEADVEALARDTRGGKFARIVAHGTFGFTCDFWGMVIPSG
jgi:hypothetical protein